MTLMPPTPWAPPPRPPTLSPADVHVWRVGLDANRPPPPMLWVLLDEAERTRARRFYFTRHRERYVVGRGVLRLLLGQYLGRPPATLTFAYGEQGKPYLPDLPPDLPLTFNVSHGGGHALMAFSLGRALGVDLEEIRPDRATSEITQRFFAPEEVEAFLAVPEADRVAAFYNAWTRKEAYIKANGKGLTLGLSNFCVSLAPGEPAALLSTRWHPADAARWQMVALHPVPGYAAALAVEGTGWVLRQWDFTPHLIDQGGTL